MSLAACTTPTHSATLRLGAVLAALPESFTHPLNHHQRRAFRDLVRCRTPALGGELWACGHCGRQVPVYHSCGNRHCPRCGAAARARWVGQRLNELLPVPYFHTVFTLPNVLNPLIQANPRPLIGLLFRAVSATLRSFARDPKHLGAEPAVLMVLHTWGSRLNLHYHIHCVVTGGGLTDNGTWAPAKSTKFLFPVKAMSPVFRGKFVDGLHRLFATTSLRFPQNNNPKRWADLKAKLYTKPWIVYAKRPFGGPAQVLKYLGRYTHRTAISDQRILAHRRGMVTFRYKDYKRGGKQRRLILPEAIFAKRFLQHVLPPSVKRVRYAGLLASCKKTRCLALARAVLGVVTVNPREVLPKREDEEFAEHEDTPRTCPFCQQPKLVFQKPLAVETSAPPTTPTSDTS